MHNTTKGYMHVELTNGGSGNGEDLFSGVLTLKILKKFTPILDNA